jgi:hypothetical protein
MSDIRKHAVAETTSLHLRDAADELMYADGPDGNPDTSKPMTVVLYGPGSKPYAKAQARNSNHMIDRLKKKGKSDQTAEEKAQDVANFLADCTKAFENIDYEGLQGEALYKAVYADQSIGFVAEQVNKHLGQWGNFTKGSTKP